MPTLKQRPLPTLLLMISLWVKTLSHHRFGVAAFVSRSSNSRMSSTEPRRTARSFAALTGNLVSVDDCLAVHGESDVKFIDGSWHLAADRDGRSEFEAGPRIEGARFFDVDDIATTGEGNPKNLPHMMPPKNLFAAAMDALDISNDDHLVVYGTEGCMATARAFYQLRAMGHSPDNVHLMQGSLKEWMDKNGKVDKSPAKTIHANDLQNLDGKTKYQATDASYVVDMEHVLKVVNADEADSIVIDARGAARFKAEAPEPRAGLRLGHMPGSFNVPFNDLLKSDDPTKFEDIENLKAAFERAGVNTDTDKKIICSCGSGVTACVIAVALEECGRDAADTVIYDGSWAEWGSEENTPIVS